MQQIDYEAGAIIDALERQGILENTYIILASDHGDYLGDHNLIGKASFFESAIRIPFVAMGPGVASGQVSDELVELRDVTATMLKWAGIEELPVWYDAIPLPGDGMPGDNGRDRIFGMLTDGWMNYDGRFKLHRYRSGEALLFDIQNDPQEQQNLLDDPDHAETRHRLETELFTEVMTSIEAASQDRLAQHGDMSQDPGFGRESWQRTYPHPPVM